MNEHRYNSLKSIAYSAIGAMLCHDFNGDSIEDVAEYLGCTVEELEELEIID